MAGHLWGVGEPEVPPVAVPPDELPEPDPLPEESVWLLLVGGVSWTLPTLEGSSTIWVTDTSSGGRLGRWWLTRTVTTHSPWAAPCSASSDHWKSGSSSKGAACWDWRGTAPPATSASLDRARWAAWLRYWTSWAFWPAMVTR